MGSLSRAVVVVVVAILAGGCSNPKDPPPEGPAAPGIHPPGWSDEDSDVFHGTVLEDVGYDVSGCRVCHGSDYDGGVVEVSCRDCHPSYPHDEGGWGPGHVEYVQSEGWNIVPCRSCHGIDYSIQKVDNSCLTCHTQDGGPEACNTCHGNFEGDASDLANAAPPTGLLGQADSLAMPVGAHARHLSYDPTRPVAETCAECHIVPENYEDPGHLDGQPGAEVVFNGPLSTTPTEGGVRVPAPVYNPTDASCSATYCHGNWGLLALDSDEWWIYSDPKLEGSSATPRWTDPATAACGSCHGLPPTGHDFASLPSCASCHPGVIDRQGEIIDTSLHLNGRVNYRDSEYPMF